MSESVAGRSRSGDRSREDFKMWSELKLKFFAIASTKATGPRISTEKYKDEMEPSPIDYAFNAFSLALSLAFMQRVSCRKSNTSYWNNIAADLGPAFQSCHLFSRVSSKNRGSAWRLQNKGQQ